MKMTEMDRNEIITEVVNQLKNNTDVALGRSVENGDEFISLVLDNVINNLLSQEELCNSVEIDVYNESDIATLKETIRVILVTALANDKGNECV